MIKMNNMLFLSNLSTWSIGKNQGAKSLWQTVISYSSNGFKVFYINSSNFFNIDKTKNVYNYTFRNPLLFLSKNRFLKIIFKLINFSYLSFKYYNIGKKIINNNKIEMIYSYEVSTVLAGFLLSKKYNLPFIRRFQGTILYPLLKNSIQLIRKYEHSLAMMIPSDLTIMTNDGTKGDKVLEFFNNDMKKVKFWMNGVDVPKKIIPKLKLINFKFDKAYFNIVTISRLELWKGVDRAIIAVAKLRELKINNFRLHIIGEGSQKENLIKLTKELGLEKYIDFVGAISHNKLKYYYQSVDLFLSLYDLSNVGNPLLEALSYGKAIITLNNGDTGKIIKNNYNKILLNLEQINKLPYKILELIKNKDLKNKLEKNARQYALDNLWSWKERMNEEVKAVRGLMNEKKE